MRRHSNRGVWLVLALFALGGAFFFGLKYYVWHMPHPPATLPMTANH